MEEIKRPHLGGQPWRDLLQRFDASGISVGEFCKRERLEHGDFSNAGERGWREASVPTTATMSVRSGEQAPTSLADLGSLGTTSAAVTGHLEQDYAGAITAARLWALDQDWTSPQCVTSCAMRACRPFRSTDLPAHR